jgi:hypothetical protein
VGPPHIYSTLTDIAASEFERFNISSDSRRINSRFDLRVPEEETSYLRLDVEKDSETKKATAWKLKGPRHGAAELNTFVVQTYLA